MFTTEAKATAAAWPRGRGSALLVEDQLQIAYVKYTATTPPVQKTQVNLIFTHGAGMNKSVWKQHIQSLYEQNRDAPWHLGHVLAVDIANHGDSALLNKGKLAWGFDWRDGGRDLVMVVKHEAQSTGDFMPSPNSMNILVGHSIGGFSCTYAAYLEPTLFGGCIAVEPVLFVMQELKDFYFSRLQKIERTILDTFDLMEQAVEYFRKRSLYRTLEPAVLKDFIEDELYEENGKFKCKASKEAQLTLYCSSMYSLDIDQEVLRFIRVPYLHIVGKDAEFNLPQTVDFVRDSIPEGLLEQKALTGTHIMFGEHVADTVEAISLFCAARAKFSEEHRAEHPVVKYGGNRQKMMQNMLPIIYVGNYDEAFWYARPRPKL